MNENRLKTIQHNCPGCKKPFNLKGDISLNKFSKDTQGQSNKLWREPHLLNCGHPICSLCIRTKEKNRLKSIICELCKSINPLEPGDENLHRYPPFTYMLGLLYQNRMPRSRVPDLLKQNFVPLESIKKRNEMAVMRMCSECKIVQATELCNDCKVVFCDSCFVEDHSMLDEKKSHTTTSLFPTSTYKITKMCETHKRIAECYCTDDGEFCCTLCSLSIHKGHDVNSVVLRNATISKAVKEAIGDLKCVHESLRNSVTQLKMTNQNKKNYSSLTHEIRATFSQIYGSLQMRENEIIEKAKELADNINGTSAIREQAEENLRRITRLLDDFQASVHSDTSEVYDYFEMLRQIEAALVFPCHLQEVRSTTKGKLRFKINSDEVKNLIKNCGEFEGIDIISSLKLVPYDKEKAKANASTFADEIDDSISVASSRSTTSLSCRRPSLQDGKSEIFATTSIRSSYIVHPGHFYVHRVDTLKKLKVLAMQLNRFGDSEQAERFLQPIKTCDLFLALFPEDKKWYRGRMLSTKSEMAQMIPPPDGDSKSYILVSYIDYGNCSYVPTSDIRVLPVQFKSLGPFAEKCSLHEIVPISSDGWDNSTNLTFNDLLNTAEFLQLRVYETKGDTQFVDIVRSAGDQTQSVREILILLRLASLETNKSESFESSMKNYAFTPFFEPILPKKNQEQTVSVVHVDNPFCFYVQRVGDDSRIFSEMQSSLQQMYRNYTEVGQMAVYCPIIGLPCVAQFTDGMWYRCRVQTDVDAHQFVDVFYVDFGNTMRVKWTALRTIRKEFLKYSGFALKCCLADVAPPKSEKNWSTEAIEFFKKKVSVSLYYQIMVTEINDNSTISVLLSRRDESDVECINYSLVAEKFAASKGLCSTPDAVNIKKSPNLIPETAASRQVHLLERYSKINSSNSQHELMAALSRPHCIANGADSFVHQNESNDSEEEIEDHVQTEMKSEDHNIPMEDIEFVEADGKIPYSESPSYICFQQFLTRQEKLQKLMLDLQRVGKNSPFNENIEWEVNSYCVVYHLQLKEWYRGLITQLVEEKKAEVYFIDYGFTQICDYAKLRVIDGKLASEPPFAMVCHLSTIKAAGDKNNWSAMACERMNEVIAEHDTFTVTILGPCENNSYPVDLFYYEIVEGGALTAGKTLKRSLSQFLLEKGMALPVKMTMGSESLEDLPNSESEEKEKPRLERSKSFEVIEEMQSSDKETAAAIVFETECHELKMSPCEVESTLGRKSSQSDDDFFAVKLPPSAANEEMELTEPEAVVEVTSADNLVTPIHATLEFNDGKQKWKNPKRLTQNEFMCKVTYVHKDGTVYVQDLAKSKDLTWMQTGLQAKFERTEPSTEDTYWYVGDICITKVENTWYRATVVENDDDNHAYVVQLLDFGSYATVGFRQMRKKVICRDIEQLSYKCILADVNPKMVDGAWPDDVLAYSRVILMDNEFKWKAIFKDYVSKEDNALRIVLLSTKDDEMLFSAMVFACDLENRVEEISSDASSGCSLLNSSDGDMNHLEPALSSCPLPDISDIIPVCITDVRDDLTICIQRRRIPNPESAFEHVTNEQLNELIEVNRYLNEKQGTLEPLEKPKVGDSVSCFFSADGGWYRGLVESCSGDDVTVLFVDYGNCERTTRDKLRKLPERCSDLPIQSYLCQLHQVVIPQGVDFVSATKQLKMLIEGFIENPDLHAQIKDLCDYIKIDLFVRQNEKFSLAYQQLIDENIIHLVREKTLAERL